MTENIIIQNIPSRIQYIADGTTTDFEYEFAVFSNDNLKVYKDSTLQGSNTYTVTTASSGTGGTISFTSAPANGTKITITRDLAIQRTSDFQDGGALRAAVLNRELDYQTACIQQLADSINRSMVLPPYAAGTDIVLTLPTPVAGKAIVWNANGTNLENSNIEVNNLESTIQGYKTNAESAKNAAETASATATAQATEAATSASTATAKATIATEQATLAATKAAEVANALTSKANTNADNFTDAGKLALLTAALSNLQTIDNTKVGYIYQVIATFAGVYLPVGGKFLILNNYLARNGDGVVFALSANNLYQAGSIVDGGVQTVVGVNGFLTLFSAIRIA